MTLFKNIKVISMYPWSIYPNKINLIIDPALDTKRVLINNIFKYHVASMTSDCTKFIFTPCIFSFSGTYSLPKYMVYCYHKCIFNLANLASPICVWSEPIVNFAQPILLVRLVMLFVLVVYDSFRQTVYICGVCTSLLHVTLFAYALFLTWIVFK